MITYNTLIVLAGATLLGACSGLVGSFAVLRRRSLTGDALAHAALPGLCLAFLILGQKNLPAMLLGALVTGLLGIGVVSGLRWTTRIKEDAALGIVLSVFFGAGIVLTRLIQNQTTTGSKAGLNSYILGKTAGMIAQDILLIGGVSLLCLLVIFLLYKEFKIVVFDPAFAGVQGWPSFWLDVLLMGMIALTVVIGLPAVGVVMMAALLIIPAASARFWTDRLETMLLLSALFGMATGTVGTLMSAHFSLLPAGPVIVLVGTGFFLISVLLAPKRGAVARTIRNYRFRKRVGEQTLLLSLYNLVEKDLPETRTVSWEEIIGQKEWLQVRLHRLLRQSIRDGYLKTEGRNGYRLTEAGLKRAAEVARAHRLWELFLTEYAESVGNFADLDSESLDEKLPREMVKDLEEKLRQSGRFPTLIPAGNRWAM